MMKKITTIFFLCLIYFCCAEKPSTEKSGITVITTLFPQYDFTKQIVQDLASVELILPPGIEPHSFEPTPQEIIRIKNADLFIYTSKYMEPWAFRLIENHNSDNPHVVDVSQNIELLRTNHDHNHNHDHKHDHSHKENSFDPHIWTEPGNAKIIVRNILQGLIEVDPVNAQQYKANAELYLKRLDTLSMRFDDLFAHTQKNTILFGGHFAFRYLAHQYPFEHISPYEGFSPNSEPSPQKIAQLIKAVEKYQLHYIFHEELLSPKIANVISNQTGVKILLLHGAHNISKKDLESGESYISIMEKNIKNLKIGLEYEKSND